MGISSNFLKDMISQLNLNRYKLSIILYDFFLHLFRKKSLVKAEICYRSMHDIIIILNKCQKRSSNFYHLKTEKIIHKNENRYFLIFFKFMNKILNLQNYFWRESKKKEVIYINFIHLF